MTATLIVLRHEHRHEHRHVNANAPFTGPLDSPLTDVGREEGAHGDDLLNDAELWPRVLFRSPPMPREQLRILNQVPEVLGLTESLHDVTTRANDVWWECIEPTFRQSGVACI